jgi:chromate transporter
VLVLSKLYFTWGDAPVVKHFFAGIVPALTALIINVAYGMARKALKYSELTALCIASALALIVIGGYATTLLVMVIGGVMGLGCRQNEAADPLRPAEVSPESAQTVSTRFRLDASMRRCLLWIGALALLIILIALAGRLPGAPIELQLFSVFSGVSLTLFGGGYVVIPALHELFVDNLQWLTEPEFADGIAIGQVTPGPIFITATFIGYKVAGLTGALLATIGIFTPPALLTVCLTSFVDTLSKSPVVKAILTGVRAAVVGLIFASAYTIGRTADPTWVSALLFGGTLIATFKYNLNPIYIILGSGVVGALLM